MKTVYLFYPLYLTIPQNLQFSFIFLVFFERFPSFSQKTKQKKPYPIENKNMALNYSLLTIHMAEKVGFEPTQAQTSNAFRVHPLITTWVLLRGKGCW